MGILFKKIEKIKKTFNHLCQIKLKESHLLFRIKRSDFFGLEESSRYFMITITAIVVISIFSLVAGIVVYNNNSNRRRDYDNSPGTVSTDDMKEGCLLSEG